MFEVFCGVCIGVALSAVFVAICDIIGSTLIEFDEWEEWD